MKMINLSEIRRDSTNIKTKLKGYFEAEDYYAANIRDYVESALFLRRPFFKIPLTLGYYFAFVEIDNVKIAKIQGEEPLFRIFDKTGETIIVWNHRENKGVYPATCSYNMIREAGYNLEKVVSKISLRHDYETGTAFLADIEFHYKTANAKEKAKEKRYSIQPSPAPLLLAQYVSMPAV